MATTSGRNLFKSEQKNLSQVNCAIMAEANRKAKESVGMNESFAKKSKYFFLGGWNSHGFGLSVDNAQPGWRTSSLFRLELFGPEPTDISDCRQLGNHGGRDRRVIFPFLPLSRWIEEKP
jgi:hypothetical protein